MSMGEEMEENFDDKIIRFALGPDFQNKENGDE